MKSNLISKSETNITLNDISEKWNNIIKIPKIKNLKMYDIDDNECILTGTGIKIARTKDGIYLPLLTETDMLEKIPHVIVDMGAIKFICKGANLMRPGITKIGKFKKDDIVCIREESKGNYLAIGQALMSSDEAQSASRGEILRNLHYVSDNIWEMAKEIRD